jgi:hypothetical protein
MVAVAHRPGWRRQVIAILSRAQFGLDGNGRRGLVSGWSKERLHAWAVGGTSIFRLNYPPASGDLQLELKVMPFVRDPHLKSQRIEISVDGIVVGAEDLSVGTWLGFRLPREAFKQTGCLEVRLRCPDAAVPAAIGDSQDGRQLGFALKEALLLDMPSIARFARRSRAPLPIAHYAGAERERDIVRGVTGLSPEDLGLSFESLGTNCDFGLFQRRCGIEPIGLLRFAGISYLNLVHGLGVGFAGIEDREFLSCRIEGPRPEWIARSELFGLEYHTDRSPSDVTAEDVLREQTRTLPFRRSKLLDLLATGEKLFVVQWPHGLTEAQALPLLTVLRSYGPNALLFVCQQTGQPAGSVDALSHDLFRGSLDGVEKRADESERVGRVTWLSDAALTAWMSVCANAYRLWREEGGGGGGDD